MAAKNIWKNRRVNLRNKISILDATVMTVVKYGSKTGQFQVWLDLLWVSGIPNVFVLKCLEVLIVFFSWIIDV